MHIIHVLTRLLRAGSEENTLETCLWQAAHGHEVTVIHGPDPDPLWQQKYGDRLRFVTVPQMVHPIRLSQDWSAIRALRRVLRDLAPDVIHTHQSKAGILGRLASTAVPGALVVHGIHIIPFDGVSRMKAAVYIAAEKLAARHTDLFIAVSRSVGQAYIDAGICTEVEPVYSGMPLEQFQNASPPADWADVLGCDPKVAPPVILMLAAYEPRKRHIPFLDAMAQVLPTLPKATRIVFAGKGPHETAVRQHVADLGLEDRVIMTGFRNDPEALIALADVCVLVSEREGLPRVVVQYVASGKPVVVADLPGITEIISHGHNGLITDPGDLSDTALALRDLLTDRNRLETLAQGAAETDVSNWELDRLGARTTALYETSLATKNGAL